MMVMMNSKKMNYIEVIMTELDDDSYTGSPPLHILYKEKLNKERLNKEKVTCEICGKETLYDETKRCNCCWEMEKGLRMLTDKDKDKAIIWLENNLKELKRTK